ncbi:hypothetical protein WN51_13122 [Melipona quadrifasciata]|uniref:Uncharacterized protein n=1 Tax=Melipona quadrifasciata TaxID=166423 RepID=A0A0M9A0J4_9HYME|nr:hypothetical protein WN51_13122 [Melipona quadrifasciata]
MQTRREMLGGEETRWNTIKETQRRMTKKKKTKRKKMLEEGKESERRETRDSRFFGRL